MKQPAKVHVPPAICRMARTGKTYAIAGSTWIEVPNDTRYSDISKYMVLDGWSHDSSDTIQHEVVGSRGNKYKVRCNSESVWSCTCPGFSFRAKCKHVTKFKTSR